MAERNNDKGVITWVFTIINLILVGGVALTVITAGVALDSWVAIGVGIILIFLAVYVIWHSIMIILGKAANTWLYVVVSFLGSFVGGILMLIAKILN